MTPSSTTDAVGVQTLKPFARTKLMPEARHSVVVFVVDGRSAGLHDWEGPGRLPELDNRPGEAWHRSIHQGERLIALLATSVRLIYPNARFVLLTDAHTQLAVIPPPVDVVRRTLSSAPLTYEKLLAYADYLESAADDETHLFLDSDILVISKFCPPQGVRFDIGLTLKKKGRINSGVMVVPPYGRERALAFLRRTLRFYQERYFKDSPWGSDQAALRDAAGLSGPRRLPELVETTDARVLLLSCDQYNYWPPNQWRLAMLPPHGKFALHFKGSLKRFMLPYFRLHIDPDCPRLVRLGLRAMVLLRDARDRMRSRRAAAKRTASDSAAEAK
jgi:hypothetical protein